MRHPSRHLLRARGDVPGTQNTISERTETVEDFCIGSPLLREEITTKNMFETAAEQRDGVLQARHATGAVRQASRARGVHDRR